MLRVPSHNHDGAIGGIDLTEEEQEELAVVIDLGSETIEGMGTLLRDSLLVDLTVKAGDKEFKAHKTYLAAVSEEFRRLIMAGKVDEGTSMMTIEVENVSPEGVEIVMEFLYEQSILHITKENLEDVLQAANHLNIDCLITKCCNFIMGTLSNDTFIQVLQLANRYSLIDVHKEVLGFISISWMNLTDSLVQLSKEDLLTVLDSIAQCETELAVFHIAKKWLEAEPERMTSAGDVMTTIKFPLMTEEELDGVLVSTPFLTEDPCRKLIEEARDYHQMPVSAKVLVNNKRTKVRGDPNHVAFFTGLSPPIPSNDFFVPFVLDVSSSLQFRWISMPSVPEPLGAASVTVINNFLVACGVGQVSDSSDVAFNDCAIFDPRWHKWTRISPMTNRRMDCALVTVGGNMYAIGGSSRWLSNYPIASVEAYDFAVGKWMEVAPLPERLSSVAACEYQGKIYVSGGIREDKSVSQDMWVYEPKIDEWSAMPKLLNTEQGHVMLPLKEGYLTLVSSESAKLYNFSFETNQWDEMKSSDWSKEFAELATVVQYTPSFSLLAWQQLDKKSDATDAASGDSSTKIEICHQPFRYQGEGMFRTKFYSTRVGNFPEGVHWRHVTLMTLPMKTLIQGKLECDPAEEENMMMHLLRQIRQSCVKDNAESLPQAPVTETVD